MPRSNHAGVHLDSILFSLLGALFLGFPAFSQDAEETIHQSGFEQDAGFVVGDVNGQLGWTVDQGRAEVTAESGLDNGGGLVIFPSDPFGQVSVRFDGARLDRDVVFIDFFVRPVAGEGWDAQFADAEGSVLGFFKVNSDGALEVLDGDGSGETEGTWVSTGVSLPLADDDDRAGEFLRLTLRQDFREGKRVWDLFVDGKLIVANAGFWTDEPDDLRRFSLMGHSEFPLVIDNVTISSANMLFTDADADGIPDDWQKALGEKNGRDDDADGDGLANFQEYLSGTDPMNQDTDHDGKVDGEEFDLGRDPGSWDQLPLYPTDEQLKRSEVLAMPFFQHGESTMEERKDLGILITSYARSSDLSDIGPILKHCEQYPGSPYGSWLKASAGKAAYWFGAFSKGERLLGEAYGALEQHKKANNAFGNLVGSELAFLQARMGKPAEDRRSLLNKLNSRDMVNVRSHRLRKMANGALDVPEERGHAALCGIRAIYKLGKKLKADPDQLEPLLIFDSSRTDGRGLSLDQLEKLAVDCRINYRKAFRSEGAKLTSPSIVHLKRGHYGILIPTETGRHIFDDLTVGGRLEISDKTLQEESSGYYLVPESEPLSEWLPVSAATGRTVFGSGTSLCLDQGEDDPCNDVCESKGVASYGFNSFRAMLVITDTPFSSRRPKGFEWGMDLTYSEHGKFDCGDFLPNAGSKWFLPVSSYAVSGGSGYDIEVYLPDGRKELHLSDNGTTYETHQMSQAVLTKEGSNTIKRNLPGGGYILYGNPKTVGSLKYYRFKEYKYPSGYKWYVSDWYGTTYDWKPKTLSDSFNELCTLVFETESNYGGYKLEEIKYHNKIATLEYNTSGELDTITDTVGIESSFDYKPGSNHFIEKMTTPYGDTTFAKHTFTEQHSSALKITDPEGHVEYIHYAAAPQTGLAGVDSSGKALTAERPSIFDGPLLSLNYCDRGVSLHWDKKAMKEIGTNINPINAGYNDKASQQSWLREGPGTWTTVGIPRSSRTALTYRTWYRYGGQGTSLDASEYVGDNGSPTYIARMVRDKGQAPGTSNPTLVASTQFFTYNEEGQVLTEEDPLGRTTKYYYDTNKVDLLTVRQVESGGAEKVLVQYADYENHLPKKIYDAGGNLRQLTYNDYGQVKSVIDPNGVKTEWHYTNGSQGGYLDMVRTKNDAGSWVVLYDVTVWDTTYKWPKTVKVNADGYEVDLEYDYLDRVTKVTHPDSTYEETVYTVDGTPTGDPRIEPGLTRDRAGKVTKYTYNDNRQLINIEDAKNQDTEYEWCSCGDLEWVIDPKGQKTQWHRDLLGRVTSKDYPSVSGSVNTITYAYQPESGALYSVTYPNDSGSSHTFWNSYYKDGKLHKTDYADSGTSDVTYEYDDYYGRMDKRIDGVGTWTFGYHAYTTTLPSVRAQNSTELDGLGQLYYTAGPWGYDTVRYYYDSLGRIDKRTLDNYYSALDHEVEYSFDDLGRLQDSITKIGTFDYDYIGDTGLLDGIAYPNGQQTDLTYHTHANGRYLSTIRNRVSSGGSYLSYYGYTYHSGGQINRWTKILKNSASTSEQKLYDHTYDDIYQTTNVKKRSMWGVLEQDSTYRYDAAGNRDKKTEGTASTTYSTINARNQIKTATGTEAGTFSYDDNGNTLYKIVNGDKTNYEWDAENRLTAVEVLTGTTPSTDDRRMEFQYNGAGQRVQIHEKKYQSGTWQTVKRDYFIWDAAKIIQKRTTSTSYTKVSANYYGNGESRHGGTSSSQKKNYFYTRDHLGSVSEMTDQSKVIKAAYRYSPWGERSRKFGDSEGLDCEFGFTGHYYEPNSKLHLTWFRGYDAGLGRWLSPDPIGEAGWINLYAYVSNNPINLWDPLGLECFGTFDVATGKLAVTDEDTGETQVIDAYSGGNPYGKPIPEGNYDILDHPKNDFFRLEPKDKKYGDDTHQPTGRDEFRLHKPGRSIGCVTAKKKEPWEKLRDMIRKTKTSTETVKSKSRNPFGPKTEKIKKFGELRVIDTSRIPMPPGTR